MRFIRTLVTAILIPCLLLMPGTLPAAAQAQSKTAPSATPYFYEPAIAPDRDEIAFVSGGDIWTAPAGGGDAHLLIAHPAAESCPLYSPDGKHLAFVSLRTGNGDIYVYTFATGETRRLTFDDAGETLSAWSRDGRWIYFHSNTHDIAGMQDVFRVSIDGGTPLAVTADRYLSEFFGAPAPDGRSLAFTARGTSSGQWWRRGHSHIDTSEVWLRGEGSPAGYERLVEGGSKNMWPMWSPDGRTIYFMSDRSGAENIWMHRIGGETRQVTRFRDGRVLWPVISWDGRTIVFERDFGIYKLDTASGRAERISLTRRSAAPAGTVERVRQSNQFGGLALSPDGRKVAFIARGEVFAAGVSDGGVAFRVTHTPAAEYHVAWSPDSKKVVYASTRNGPGSGDLFLFDFTSEKETQLTRGATEDYAPIFSPDGNSIAFLRDGRELRVLDVKSGEDRALTTAGVRRPPFGATRPMVWSADSKWIAYLSSGEKSFTNAHVIAAAGGESRPVSYIANAFANTVSWAPDGSFILFDTGQRTETRQLARVDLVPRTPRFREDQFRELFREEQRPTGRGGEGQRQQPSKVPPKPVQITFDDIGSRLDFIPVGVDLGYQVLSPDGKTVLVIGSAAGQTNLYTYSLDELARGPAVARQLTSTPGFKSNAQFTPDGREVFFIQQGRIQRVNVENRQVRALDVTAEFDVDFETEKMEVFQQAWTIQRDHFYDEKFHGADWNAVRNTWAPYIAGSRTRDEMRRLLSLMVGELNASHLGVGGASGSVTSNNGRLGLRFDRAEYESAGRLRITEVIAQSPAAIGGIKAGEYLVAVDGARITGRTNLDELMAHKSGRRTVLTVAAAADGTGGRDIPVQPVSVNAEKGLLYRHWVESRRAYVERVSNGRLGYVHMLNMGAGALAQLFVDLDTQNHGRDGVVVDIRNNSGGFVNAYAIDVFARRPYLQMSVRGLTDSAPARSVLGQRALERPTILVTNQHSLSDAEDFTEGYRALKLGKVVGEPTSGWIVYTSNFTLIDGTSFRVPFMRVTTMEGVTMELNPRPVDVPVQRPVGESYTDRDAQLDTAVAELLKQLGPKR